MDVQQVLHKLQRDLRRALVRISDLERTAREKENMDPTGPEIIAEVCDHHGVAVKELLSCRRDAFLVRAREEACWRLRDETAMTYPAIGRLLNRDHTSVIAAVRRYQRRRAA